MPFLAENDVINGRTCIKVKDKDHPMTCLCGNRREVEVQHITIRNPALKRDEWSAESSGRFTLWENPVQILQEAGWFSGSFWKGVENHTSIRITSPIRSIPQPDAIVTTCDHMYSKYQVQNQSVCR